MIVESASGEDACPADIGRVKAARKREDEDLVGLVGRSAAGDTVAFAELYDRTCNRVYGMVFRVLRDRGFAEETTQEVYLQVWKACDAFDPAKGSVIAWMMTLAHRRAVDRVRSEQASTAREATYEASNRVGDFDQVTDEVWQLFEREAVIACLDRLTDTQRESIALAYYGGRSYREVANHLDVAVPTVKSRIRDGLTRLRNCLGLKQ